jgi:hypothetical protein
VLSPVLRDVHHPYSDKPTGGINAYCYNFSEVFAEKIRALSERARPRDLYDVIHLYRHAFPGEKSNTIFDVLKKKCEYKSIPLPTIELLAKHPKLHELESEWASMLAHQVPMLPLKDQFWQDLPNMFEWLHGDSSKLIRAIIHTLSNDKIDPSWQPPSMIKAWGLRIPLELIRYAGANHLCVKIDYKNDVLLIEPYDLKKTQDGALTLIAINHENGALCSFHINDIKKIDILKLSFTPQYFISLTPF